MFAKRWIRYGKCSTRATPSGRIPRCPLPHWSRGAQLSHPRLPQTSTSKTTLLTNIHSVQVVNSFPSEQFMRELLRAIVDNMVVMSFLASHLNLVVTCPIHYSCCLRFSWPSGTQRWGLSSPPHWTWETNRFVNPRQSTYKLMKLNLSLVVVT